VIPEETVVEIRRLFYGEHFTTGTIARLLKVHHETVERAIGTERFHGPRAAERASVTRPFHEFLAGTLKQYPRLRATRLFEMVRQRGYAGSLVQLRRAVRGLRPVASEAFLKLRKFPGEEAQVDWAHFGTVRIGRAERKLSCFVLTLSYSRALYLEFFFDQHLESFLAGHVNALSDLGGVPRTFLTDNLAAAVIERVGAAVRFNPHYLELCAHYHSAPRPCAVARGNEKGRVERAIQYVRHSFFAARPFTTLEDFNRKALAWRDEVAHTRPWPGDDRITVAEALEQERPSLLPLPVHPFETARLVPAARSKTIYVRFDLNDYSIPPGAVGKPVTLAVTSSTVRILNGAEEIARHPRCWDRHALVEIAAHKDALLREKRKALGSTPSARLLACVPKAEAFLEAAVRRGASPGVETRRLLALLRDYGAEPLAWAVEEAFARGTPRAASVHFLLESRRRSRRIRSAPALDLRSRPELEQMHVTPHDLETYDDLADNED